MMLDIYMPIVMAQQAINNPVLSMEWRCLHKKVNNIPEYIDYYYLGMLLILYYRTL